MPELLFSFKHSTPEQRSLAGSPKTPLDDISNIEKCSNQYTPRAQPHDNSLTPEIDDLVRAPYKLSLSPEDSHKPGKLSGCQLKFEDCISLQSIINVKISKKSKDEEEGNSNPFCENKENNFVPLKPQTNGRRSTRGTKNKKRIDRQKSLPSENIQETFCQVTPQKKNMPLLYGADVVLESPDPMSKYNSANQTTSDLQKGTHKNTRISVLLQNCKQDVMQSPEATVPRLGMNTVESIPVIRDAAAKLVTTDGHQFDKHGLNVSPDAITEDIYDFNESKTHLPSYKVSREGSDSCKYLMSNDTLKEELSPPPPQKMSEMEDLLLTTRVHAARHKSVRVAEKNTMRRSLSPSLNALEKQLQDQSSGFHHKMPTSRSLDTLQPQTPTPPGHGVDEGQYIALKPTPPSSGSGQAQRTTFNRKSPQAPYPVSPKVLGMSSSHSSLLATPPSNKEGLEANIRQSRGRRYTNPVSPVVEETKEQLTSPPATNMQRPMPSRPSSNPFRRRPQPPTSPSRTPASALPSTVHVDYSITSPPRQKKMPPATSAQSPVHASDIPHPSPKRKKGDTGRTVTVSGFSKQLLVSLINAASKKRRRKNKHQPAFTMKLEKIPEDDPIVLKFPSWIITASGENVSNQVYQQIKALGKPAIEKSAERMATESEYRGWLRSQVEISPVDQHDPLTTPLSFLMLAIQFQDNDEFKRLLAQDKNIIFARDHNGNTALVVATLFGWKRGIKNLIKRGADLDAQNRFGNTSLHYASAFEEHHEIQKYLLRKRASATIRNERGICSCDSC